MNEYAYRKSIKWSHNLTAYVTRAFLEENGVESVEGRYSIDPALCSIRENVFGFYDLMFKGKKIRRITFGEYLELKDIVADSYKEVLE